MGLNTVASNLISKTFANTLVSGLTLSKSATWVKTTAGTFTPLTGAVSRTETNATINVIETEYTTTEILASGGAILNTDRKVICEPVAGVTFENSVGDSLTVGTRTHRIMAVKSLVLGSDELVWDCQCRGN